MGLGDLDKLLDSEVGEFMVFVLGWVGNGAGSDPVKRVVESWDLGASVLRLDRYRFASLRQQHKPELEKSQTCTHESCGLL